MIFTGRTDFCDFLDREIAERKKERFRKRYLDGKRIPVPKKRRGLFGRLKEREDGDGQGRT